MKALVIYDTTGRVWNVTYGEDTLPTGISGLIVDVPEGQSVHGVDLSGESPTVVFEELPASEVQRLENAINALTGAVNGMAVNVTPLAVAATFAAETFTDEQALQVKVLYPEWATFIGKKLKPGKRARYNDKLFKVKQDIEVVLENQPPSINTAALYEEIVESHAGTIDDPIPYDGNMELFADKYYTHDGVLYRCTRNTEQAVYQPLSELVGIYVEVVE